MITGITGNEENQAREIAEKIINAIADCNYALVGEIAHSMGENNWSVDDLEEFVETFKSDNEIDSVDRYDVVCKFNVVYKNGSHYEQEQFYNFNNGGGFRYEYDLTTD